jgi:type III restriction enzyme
MFIVVCNNTNVSKLVFDFIGGWEKQIGDKSVAQAGQLAIFRNDDGNGGWLHRPNTILVDSQQLESAKSRNSRPNIEPDFPDALQTDLLREVMNTVGKAGKLGENVKCVVSVSMLTEGWDTNTVTHVLGLRAFSTRRERQ